MTRLKYFCVTLTFVRWHFTPRWASKSSLQNFSLKTKNCSRELFRKIVKVCSTKVNSTVFLSYIYVSVSIFIFVFLARVLFANANSITQHRFTFTFPYGVSNRPFGDISISTQRLQTDWRKPSFLLLARRGWISQSFSFLPPKKRDLGFSFFLPYFVSN
jgi:hypothetical protein